MAEKQLWPHQARGLAALWAAIECGQKNICLTSPTGGGKCLHPDTPVMLHDGSAKACKDIVVGDMLMGPDSTPRRVLGTCTGHAEMYEVVPTKGEPFIANGDHILVLKYATGTSGLSRHKTFPDQTVELSIDSYNRETNYFKHTTYLKKPRAVEFPPQPPLPIDPYFIGIWIGDGSWDRPRIHKPDLEIRSACEDVARQFNCNVSTSKGNRKNDCETYSVVRKSGRDRNLLTDAMESIGLLKSTDKVVPARYLTASQEDRLQLLAGMLDTDGSIHNGGFDFVQKNKSISEAVVFLARSLGFAAYMKECRKECVNNGVWGTYYRVSISGDCDRIPTRLPRKKAPPRLQAKDHLVTGFKIKPLGLGDYAGFELDGDGRFLLGDFTISHNTQMTVSMLRECHKRGWKAAFFTHRRLLLRQTHEVFEKDNIPHGIRAAGYEPNLDAPIQLSSSKTEVARVLKRKQWGIHCAKLVVIDELHVNKDEQMKALIAEHRKADPECIIVGLTATPVDVWDVCDSLIVAGINSELRETTPPAHLWCDHYCPDEPDLKGMKRSAAGEYKEGDLNKRFMVPVVFGRVFMHWKKYNPEAKPTILFAPSVAASRYFVDEFTKKGVPAAHIDGESIYWGEINADGEQVLHYTTDPEDRDEVFRKLESGEIKIVCNRFVLVEGLDKPFVYCGIFACSYGSLATWLQAAGRIVRGHPSHQRKCIIDHGGMCRRFGWANMDREWEVGKSWKDYVKPEADQEEPGKPPKDPNDTSDPIICPKCNAYRLSGPVCPVCGMQSTRSKVMVLQLNGKLKPYEQVYKPKKVNTDPPAVKDWKSLVYRVKNAHSSRGMTFEMMLNAFKREHRGCIVHPNKDKHGIERWCVLHDGKVVPLPLLPPIKDSHMMSLRVGQVSPDDFKALYRLSSE